MTETLLTREEIKDKLANLELETATLKAKLPSPFLKFFRFRLLKPKTSVMIYASDREEAEEKVGRRLDNEYGPDNWELHPKVDVYEDVRIASLNSAVGSSLLDCLTEEDSLLFLSHWDEFETVPGSARPFQKSRAKTSNRKRRMNTLERDIEHFRQKLRAERLANRQQPTGTE